ncbi:MAG: helix-turn-helix domain-containing protein [Acholeplasmatales bacterium]|nr:helix-turn-helix domain-containing protein [Acholeplasmatales bacterium]
MNTKEILKQLTLGCANYHQDRSYRGIIAKNARVAKCLTLTEVSENICSISYLSKVENNIVEINRKVFRKLRERLKIPENIIEAPTEKPDLNLIMVKFINHETIIYNEVATDYGFFDLLKPCILLMEKKYVEFSAAIEQMVDNCMYYSEIEFNFMLALLASYYLELGNYFDARQVIKHQKNIPEDNISYYLYYVDFICASRLKNKRDALDIYYRQIIKLYRNNLFPLVREIDYHLILLDLKYWTEEEFKKKLSRNNWQPDEIKYLTSLRFFVNNHSSKTALDELSANMITKKQLTIDEIILNILILDKLGNTSLLGDYFSKIKTNNENLKKLLMYLHVKYFANKSDLMPNLKSLFLSGDFYLQDGLLLGFIRDDVTLLCSRLHYYKESLMYYNRLVRYINHVSAAE